MYDEINDEDIKVGQQYQYEEKYYTVNVVTVLAEKHGAYDEMHSKTWRGWIIRVDEVIGGMSPAPVGHEFSCGYDSEYPVYKSFKFKPVGSLTDYMLSK